MFQSIGSISELTLKFGQDFLNAVVQYKTEKLQTQIEHYKTESEKAQEAIEEMAGDYLYIPFDSYNAYYDNLYEVQYSLYDSSMYDMQGQIDLFFNRSFT
jgi:hypothetical protein